MRKLPMELQWIDDVSAQLHVDDAPNGVAVNSDEVEELKPCEGCFCDGATCRAKDDHNMDLGFDKRESNPKFNRGSNIQPKG